MEIKYIKGDATRPKAEGQKIIAHVCNDIGKWGKGFVMSLSKRWKEPEIQYRNWAKYNRLELGDIKFVRVEDDIIVANMIAQVGIYPKNGIPPIRYDALEMALQQVSNAAEAMGASVHMPRIGCGLAGGDWEVVESIIKDVFYCDVTVYDLK